MSNKKNDDYAADTTNSFEIDESSELQRRNQPRSEGGPQLARSDDPNFYDAAYVYSLLTQLYRPMKKTC